MEHCPDEIIVLILDKLSTNDIFNIRLINNLFHKCSFNSQPFAAIIIEHFKNGDINEDVFKLAQNIPNFDFAVNHNCAIKWAVNIGSVPYVEFLIDHGGDLDIDKAFFVACCNGRFEMVKYLVQHGANIHRSDDYAIVYASQNGHLETVQFLIQLGLNIHVTDDYALRLACLGGYFDVVKCLVHHGADIHVYNGCPLRWTCEYGHLDIVKFLLHSGADIHANNGCALRWASRNGHLDIVRYLIDHGADIHAFNDDSVQWASEYGHYDVVNYLVQHGANLHAHDYCFWCWPHKLIGYFGSFIKK